MPPRPILHIGNRNYSSWSLRPWLALTWAGVDFAVNEIRLDQVGYGCRQVADVLAVSPTGAVPSYHVDGSVIWESLAICELAAEAGELWPEPALVRAVARSAAAEMHSGFAALRRDLPMNILRRCHPQAWAPETAADIVRIDALWSDLRARFGSEGDHLFGARSIADAMFTPVATRLRTYGVKISPLAARYRDTLLADPDFLTWEAACDGDSWDQSGFSIIDRIYA